MKTMKYLFAVIAALLAFTSCEEDGDKIYLQSLGGNELIASTNEVTLSPDVAQQIVLSFAWTDQTIIISDENVGTAAKVVTSLEASLSEDFSGTVSRTETTSLSHAFTGAALNTIANAIGATVGQANTVWFRLGSATGTNIPPAYSNVIKVSVTPYEMDMKTGIILDASKNATGETLYSANADGIYSGFIAANGWEEFYMREGNGIIWGNVGEDGNKFLISSEPTQWNMWFPAPSGCYYAVVNTVEEEWSALHISSLTANGLVDEAITLNYNENANEWIGTFTADAAGNKTITIEGQGEQFNATTGDGEDAGVVTAVAFATEGEHLVLAETAGSISVEIPQAGECTLQLNLSDPTNWTVTVEAGGTEIPEEPEISSLIYLPGLYQNTGEEWNWNSTLTLMYPDEDMKYSGVLQVNATDGHYDIYTINEWNDDYKYCLDSNDNTSTATEGVLVNKGSKHIPAPTNGVYLFDIDLKNLSYKLTSIGNTIYLYNGMDGGQLSNMESTGTAGEYSTTLELTANSTWGIKFYLFNDWTGCFGSGGDGQLYYSGNSDANGIACNQGKFTIKVNIINKTYSIEPINE